MTMTENIWHTRFGDKFDKFDSAVTVYLDKDKIRDRIDARGWTPAEVAKKLQDHEPNGKDRLPWFKNVLRGHRNDAGRTLAYVRPDLAFALIGLLKEPSETIAETMEALVLDCRTLAAPQSRKDIVLALLSERLATRPADPALPQPRLDSPVAQKILLKQEEELISLVGSLLLVLLGRNEPEEAA